MNRTDFLKAQTLSGANKCMRTPIPHFSVKDAPCSLPERKALALAVIFENMPVFIGEKELIVGTRTYFAPNPGNEDGKDKFNFGLFTPVEYVNDEETACFGCDQSYSNRTHFTPDLSVVLNLGISGIIKKAENRMLDPQLSEMQKNFLSAVIIAWKGLAGLILRYSEKAESLALAKEGAEKEELLSIARILKKIAHDRPDTFREAVQLLWLTHLGLIIESFEFINYGRLDRILQPFLKDTPLDEAREIIECLLLKMYDQADLNTTYLGKYASQLVVTLGGVDTNGEDAVNDVTYLFLDAIDKTRLPEPEFNLRISSKNPHAFLEKAACLTVTGCNFVSYYNDDLFVKSLTDAGIRPEYARSYAFDLCQDINIPGKGDFWLISGYGLSETLMALLKSQRGFDSFDSLMHAYKAKIKADVHAIIDRYNALEAHMANFAAGDFQTYFESVRSGKLPPDRNGNSPMAPLPLLSALFEGSIENALDVAFEPYPVKEKGFFFGTATEAVNALSAIKKAVFEDKTYTLDEVFAACEQDFKNPDGEIMRNVLWNCPKWGNDDAFADDIAKDLLEYCLREAESRKTFLGGRVLGGIHQPHPVPTGASLMATPEGRHAGMPVAVTLTPESGTMKNGPTAALASASKINPALIQWNYCVMINYFSSVFQGNSGANIFLSLLDGYFRSGGMQHQPNVTNVSDLKKAQLSPDNYKDLIVRLWGVSAHFVDLPRELQDEMIARFE